MLDLIHPYPEPDPDEQARGAGVHGAARARSSRDEVGRRADRARRARSRTRVIERLRELGAFGIKIPREYGGPRAVAVHLRPRRWRWSAPSRGALVALLSAHQSIGVPQPLKLFGTEEQKKRFLPRLAKGAISAFALTENDVGSDPGAHGDDRGARRPTAAAYILERREAVVHERHASPSCSWSWRARRASDGKPGPISAFIVETNSPGVEVVAAPRVHGHPRHRERADPLHERARAEGEPALGRGQGARSSRSSRSTPGRLTLPATCAAPASGACRSARAASPPSACSGDGRSATTRRSRRCSPTWRRAPTRWRRSPISARCSATPGKSDIRLEAAIAKLVEHRRRVGAVRRGAAGPRRARLRDRALAGVARRGADPARAGAARPAHQPHLRGHEPGHAAVHRARGARPAPEGRGRRRDAGRAARQAARRAACAPGSFYAAWYPSRWLGWGRWPQYAEFGPLAGHLRWIERTSRRLARQQFHLMVLNGPSAREASRPSCSAASTSAPSCSRWPRPACARCAAHGSERRRSHADGARRSLLCRNSRRKVNRLFAEVRRNDDPENATASPAACSSAAPLRVALSRGSCLPGTRPSAASATTPASEAAAS